MDQLGFYNGLVAAAIAICGQHEPIAFTKTGATVKDGHYTAFATNSSIIFSEGLNGRLTLSFSSALAEHLVRSWCGVSDPAEVQRLLPDTVGEIANLISATAIGKFDHGGRLIDVSTPAVVTGARADATFEGRRPLAVHLTSPQGDLEINVIIGENG